MQKLNLHSVTARPPNGYSGAGAAAGAGPPRWKGLSGSSRPQGKRAPRRPVQQLRPSGGCPEGTQAGGTLRWRRTPRLRAGGCGPRTTDCLLSAPPAPLDASAGPSALVDTKLVSSASGAMCLRAPGAHRGARRGRRGAPVCTPGAPRVPGGGRREDTRVLEDLPCVACWALGLAPVGQVEARRVPVESACALFPPVAAVSPVGVAPPP